MRSRMGAAGLVLAACLASTARAAVAERVVDVPTRPGIVERVLLLTPEAPKAALILFAGGHGGLQITPGGELGWGRSNFLVRARELFAASDLTVAIVDAPSDRQREPYLSGFRQTREHVADAKAVIAWLRQQADVPVWLVGTSRGTQSAAFIATELPRAAGGPDGIVLTSTILADRRSRAVPELPLGAIAVPVLVVHHREDACGLCDPGELPRLMQKLTGAPRKELVLVDGGTSRGDPCQAMAHHGYDGIEQEVVRRIAAWIAAR